MKYFFVLFMLLRLVACSYVEVANEQSGRWLKDRSPYVVVGDIKVPHGATLVIEQGTVVLFGGFYTFRVSGNLIAEGTENFPVVLTSIKSQSPYGSSDSNEMPEPMDWNHFEISQSGALKLSYCCISYSFDIIQSATEDIFISNLNVKANGISKINVKGTDIPIDTTRNFHYNFQPEKVIIKNDIVSPAAGGTAIYVENRGPKTKRRYGRYVFLGGTALCVGSIYAAMVMRKQEKPEKSWPIPDPPAPPENP
ncbi:MAG: hypothetical protein AB1633_08760 [Elusimicrobiota bacterium]